MQIFLIYWWTTKTQDLKCICESYLYFSIERVLFQNSGAAVVGLIEMTGLIANKHEADIIFELRTMSWPILPTHKVRRITIFTFSF